MPTSPALGAEVVVRTPGIERIQHRGLDGSNHTRVGLGPRLRFEFGGTWAEARPTSVSRDSPPCKGGVWRGSLSERPLPDPPQSPLREGGRQTRERLYGFAASFGSDRLLDYVTMTAKRCKGSLLSMGKFIERLASDLIDEFPNIIEAPSRP